MNQRFALSLCAPPTAAPFVFQRLHCGLVSFPFFSREIMMEKNSNARNTSAAEKSMWFYRVENGELKGGNFVCHIQNSENSTEIHKLEDSSRTSSFSNKFSAHFQVVLTQIRSLCWLYFSNKLKASSQPLKADNSIASSSKVLPQTFESFHCEIVQSYSYFAILCTLADWLKFSMREKKIQSIQVESFNWKNWAAFLLVMNIIVPESQGESADEFKRKSFIFPIFHLFNFFLLSCSLFLPTLKLLLGIIYKFKIKLIRRFHVGDRDRVK